MFRQTLLLILSFCFSFTYTIAQNALCFDGSNDGVNCGNSALHAVGDTNFSLEAWVYVHSFPKNVFEGSVVVRENNNNNGGWMFRVGDGGRVNFAMGEGKGQDWAELTTDAVLKTNNWYHLAATYNGKHVRIYIDGVLEDSLAQTMIVGGVSAVPLTIGYHPNYGRHFDGIIDEVRIWDRTLSQSEIQSKAKSEFCDTSYGLVGYYKFDEGTASGTNTSINSTSDYSGNALDGTLTNFSKTGTCSNFIKGYGLTQDTSEITNTITTCDRFYDKNTNTWYYQDTTLVHYALSNYGCVDEITTTVTVNHKSYATLTATACDSFVAPSGLVYYSSGTYTDRITNAEGCDSIITLKLTISGDRLSLDYDACYSTKLIGSGITVTESGVYVDSLKNTDGCDSIVTHNVTIKDSSSYDSTLYFCLFIRNPTGKEIWTEPGIYKDTLINSVGCDSFITYTLVSKKTYSDLSVEACEEYISPSGKVITSTGIYKDTLLFSNSQLCDSIITIDLSIHRATKSQLTVEACGELVLASGKLVTESGNYTDSITNHLGCDSVISYDVTIKTVNVAVEREDFKLTALSGSASAFQWLNCEDNMSPINGANEQSFQNPEHGIFAVEVTEENCVDTSECLEINGLSIGGLMSPELLIVPNPTTGSFSIERSSSELVNLIILNTHGQLVFTLNDIRSKQVNIESQFSSGIYEIVLISADKIQHRTLVIQ